MKIRYLICSAAVAMTLGLASCDTVDKNDRYIYVEPPKVELPPADADEDEITEAPRGVLIEDFTGQLCINCPDAVPVIEELEEAYPGLVITVGIQPVGISLTIEPEYGGLSTSAGKEYYEAAGSPAMPAGRISRRGGTETIDKWSTRVMDILKNDGKAPVWLRLSNVYDADTRNVSIEVRAKGFENVSGKLQLWLVEDGIVAYQRMQDGSGNMEYVHNHVFRAAANGTWGDDFSISKDEIKSVTCEAAIDASWVAENVSVVAIVYNDGGVQQVVKSPVVTAASEDTGDDAGTGAE